MSKKMELKPCPFCGGEAYYMERPIKNYPNRHEISCENNGCEVGVGVSERDHATAIRQWNTRTPSAEAQVPEYMRGDPRAAESPPQREEETAYWKREKIISALVGAASVNMTEDAALTQAERMADAILALYPARDGREAAIQECIDLCLQHTDCGVEGIAQMLRDLALSGEKGKPE